MNHTYVLYCNVFIDEQIGVKVIHTDDKFVLVYLLFIFPIYLQVYVYTTKQFKTKNYRQQLSLVFALILKTERKGGKIRTKTVFFFFLMIVKVKRKEQNKNYICPVLFLSWLWRWKKGKNRKYSSPFLVLPLFVKM